MAHGKKCITQNDHQSFHGIVKPHLPPACVAGYIKSLHTGSNEDPLLCFQEIVLTMAWEKKRRKGTKGNEKRVKSVIPHLPYIDSATGEIMSVCISTCTFPVSYSRTSIVLGRTNLCSVVRLCSDWRPNYQKFIGSKNIRVQQTTTWLLHILSPFHTFYPTRSPCMHSRDYGQAACT